MPHHIHTPPQCGFWTGHDPSCFDQALGAEVECVLIEGGKNKGNYFCIHKRAPETGSGRDGMDARIAEAVRRAEAWGTGIPQTTPSFDDTLLNVTAAGAREDEHGFKRALDFILVQEYPAIYRELRGLTPASDTPAPATPPQG